MAQQNWWRYNVQQKTMTLKPTRYRATPHSSGNATTSQTLWSGNAASALRDNCLLCCFKNTSDMMISGPCQANMRGSVGWKTREATLSSLVTSMHVVVTPGPLGNGLQGDAGSFLRPCNNLRPERSNKVIEPFSNGVGRSGKTSRSSWVAGIHV